MLKLIQQKVMKGTHLPVTIKEIQAEYLNNPYFEDMHVFRVQNKLPNTKVIIRKVETLGERYMLLHSLLLKILNTLKKETALLAICETLPDKIISLHHSHLFAKHQAVIMTYLTIGDKFFI